MPTATPTDPRPSVVPVVPVVLSRASSSSIMRPRAHVGDTCRECRAMLPVLHRTPSFHRQ